MNFLSNYGQRGNFACQCKCQETFVPDWSEWFNFENSGNIKHHSTVSCDIAFWLMGECSKCFGQGWFTSGFCTTLWASNFSYLMLKQKSYTVLCLLEDNFRHNLRLLIFDKAILKYRVSLLEFGGTPLQTWKKYLSFWEPETNHCIPSAKARDKSLK